MINTRFEVYKIKRELKRSGIEFEFRRTKKNDFDESVDDLIAVGKLKGLYHEQNSTVQITTGDTTQTRTKKVPMILCLYKDTASLALKVGDIVKINAKTLKVTGVTDIQEWNLISDISLEVVDNGIPA
ncbi:MAG: hypothetical protein UHD64_02995 [Bacteroidales bacterium]|nr:hypothetical protein [Bacteroidales bacterium]